MAKRPVWDCIAGQHLLRRVGASGVCLAAPGAGTFKPEYVPLFARRAVSLLYDHDDAGREGERRVHKLLSGSAASLKFLHWPQDKPAGDDVRDFVTEPSRSGIVASGW